MMKKEKKYKVSMTWLVGWIVLIPLRFLLCLIFALAMTFDPQIFYSFRKTPAEKDQSKWKL